MGGRRIHAAVADPRDVAVRPEAPPGRHPPARVPAREGEVAHLTVSDEGAGIPQRVHSRVFERLYTADSAGGSGLGLAIARELALRMQGSLSISSSRRFTAFTLDLPPAAEVAPPADAAVARSRG